MSQFDGNGAGIEATLVRPTLPRRLSRISGARTALTADRLAARLWDYPRLVRGISGTFDVFHVVDHSYSQLVHELPPGRTLVTCHDLDTFRSVLAPGEERRSAPFRAMTRHILDGFRKAAHVACDTEATRAGVIGLASIPPERASVVYNGPHPACMPGPDASADADAARLMGQDGRWTDLLHVGSTIPRKRIEDLLRIVAAVPQRQPDVRLVRVGGPFTRAQEYLARELGVTTLVLPFIDRRVLAAVYRRAALVLVPSEREGFGLPVLEALACGTPVVASAIPAIREVGGEAVTYCAVGDVAGWARATASLLGERASGDPAWQRRTADGLARAGAFTWQRYADRVAQIYRALGPGASC